MKSIYSDDYINIISVLRAIRISKRILLRQKWRNC